MAVETPQSALRVDELDRRSRLDTAIAACAQRFAETHDLYDILRSAVWIIRDHIRMDRVGIFLYDEENKRFKGSTGTDERGGLRDERTHVLTVEGLLPAQRVLREEADEFFTENYGAEFPGDAKMAGVKNLFFLAMRAHGRLLGAISADNLLSQRPIDDETRETLRRFARYVALAIENHQLLNALEVKNQALEKELARSRELVNERDRVNRDLREFAYIVSHDLKAPLRGISSLASWIEEDCGERLDGEGLKKLHLLIERTHRMHDLIEGILRYSRVGTTATGDTAIDSGAVVGGVIDLLAPPPGVSIIVADGLPTVRFDRTQLEQVFQNLIGNAIAHMGRADGTIRVGAERSGGEAVFCVKDDGVGIAPKHFERIFRIFQTLGSNRDGTSSGIGLAVVKKIIESRGGRIWVESAPGEGATFYFTVPAKKPAGITDGVEIR
jgi:signal transduction histidine kinase